MPFAASSILPDLTVLVRYVQTEGRGSLRFTLFFRDASREGNFEEHGPIIFEREPEAYFQTLIEDIEKPAGAQATPEALARRLAGKGKRLSEELLPDSLRRRLWELREQVQTVQIFSEEPWIPWELLKLSGDAGEPGPFLGEAFAISRGLRGTREASCLPLSQLAVVIPRDSGLRHAEAERRLLLGLRGDDRRVEEIPARTEAVAGALDGGSYDGWHFAGHGAARGTDPQRWRLQLEELETLHADDLEGAAHLQGHRPLVFLNGCRTARGGLSLTSLGGWAQGFLRAGAGAFLGAQWEVGDEPALAFAEVFYPALLAGEPAGEAVRQARLALRDRFPGDPAWLAYTLFANPSATCLPAAGSRSFVPAAASAPPAIREPILDFSRWLAEEADGFVGRRWIFAELDRFFADHSRGYFVVQGEPGIGKSSLLAELVRRHGWIHHFNLRAEGVQTAGAFLGSICAQLIAACRLEHSILPARARENGRVLAELLAEAAARRAPGEKVVLVVDALDEALRDPAFPDANVLFLPRRLPPGVYLVVSCRPGTVPLLLDDAPRTFEIRQDDAANLDDVRELIERRLSPGLLAWAAEQRLDTAGFVAEMVERSQGNFMYLRHVLPEIEAGAYQGLRFDRLPDGLGRYYEDHWRRIRAQDEAAWFDWKLPVLEALTVVQEPVSARLLGRFAGVEDSRRVQAVLDRWREFLYQTTVVDPETGEPQKRYRLYHASFQEFIAAKDEVREERVRLKDRHGRIADVLWRDLFGANP